MEEQKRKDAKELIELVPAAMLVDIYAFFEEWAEKCSSKEKMCTAFTASSSCATKRLAARSVFCKHMHSEQWNCGRPAKS